MTRIKYIFILLLIATISCISTKSQSTDFFKIKSATYQSWLKNENDKGTNITIEITHIKNGVVIDSIVFRNLRTAVIVEQKKKSILINAIYELGIPKLTTEMNADSRPDMIVYHINNSKYYAEIKSWKRKNMKYR